MAENTVKVDISFQSLLAAILSLEIVEQQKLWEILNNELFSDDEETSEDMAEIQAARADYCAGNYMTFEEYRIQRANQSV